MTQMIYKFVCTLGLFSLLHTAYSATQHRSYLRLTEQHFTYLPLDILLQGLISLLVTMYGVMYIAGDFIEIRANIQLQTKTWDTLGHRPSFMTFSHRARCLRSHFPSQITN